MNNLLSLLSTTSICIRFITRDTKSKIARINDKIGEDYQEYK